MKTNKSFTKRLKITKNGKIIARRPGKNHFNAKEKRSTQMAGNRSHELGAETMTTKVRQLFITTAARSKN